MQYFNDFLHKYIEYLCSRCEGKGHNKGVINNYLKPKNPISIDFLENYFDDAEHGFFHGLTASFIVYLVNERNYKNNKVDNLEKHFASSTLHDFLKCNGYSQNDHDKKLVDFFDKLLEETYSHSDPKDKDYDKHIIIADRLELRRYDDYKDWVDKRFFDLYEMMDEEMLKTINLFYDTVRPALLYFYKNRKKPFIRHGMEHIDRKTYKKGMIFPPQNSYSRFHKKEDYYSIEIDTPPFCSTVDSYKVYKGLYNDKQNGCCSNHDGFVQWNRLKGFITNDDFKDCGGEICISNKRDHLYATSQIELSNWTFMYQNVEWKIYEKKYNPCIHVDQLIGEGCRVVSQETVYLFFQLVKILQSRLIVLCS